MKLKIVQRTDVEIFAPAKDIDPEYAKALKLAVDVGVEVIVMQAKVSPEKIAITKKLQVEI